MSDIRAQSTMTPVMHRPTEGLSISRAAWLLLRSRFKIVRNTYWRGSPRRKIGALLFTALLLVGSWGVYWIMRAAIRFLTSPFFTEALQDAARQVPDLPADFQPFLLSLPSLALFGALVLLIFTSFSSVLSALYLAGDIDMLVVAPVPMRAVFIVKFFGGLIVPYIVLFFLLGPALVGFGQGMRFGPIFYLVTLFVLLLFPLLPAGVGALLVMAVVRVIPARRAREIVGAIGGLFGISWYIFNQFARELTLRYGNVQTLAALQRVDMPWLPSAWAGRALVAAGQGEWTTLLAYGGLFAGLSIAVFAGCVLLAERLYYVGWSNMAIQGGRVRPRRRRVPVEAVRPASRLLAFIPAPSRAIVAKDLRVFPRDLRNLQQILFPLALAGYWAFRLVTIREPSGFVRGASALQFLNLFAPTAISFFVCLAFSSALGGSGVNREGKGYWLLQVAPISAWGVLLGKLTLAYLPYPVVGTLLVGLFSMLQGGDVLTFLQALALVLLVGLGVSSLGIGLSAAFPRLDWVNPGQQTSIRAALLTGVVFTVYLSAAAFVAFVLPLVARFYPNYATILTGLSWLLLIALTLGVAWGSLAFGAARLERMELT